MTETMALTDTRNTKDPTDPKRPGVAAAIRVRGLRKTFNAGEIKAVDGVELTVEEGEIFSLLGPNGAGKSTIIRMLTTVLQPDVGKVTIAGYDLQRQAPRIRHEIGVCPQEIVIFEELSAEDNVAFVARVHDLPKAEARSRARRLLEKMGLADRQDRAKHFSGGMKRRLNLAMALVHRPTVVFLDEPTAGLDPQARRLVWDFIRGLKEHGMTVLLTTHDMVEAEAVSDHVAIIDHGQIIAYGTVDALKEQYGSDNVLEIQFDQPASVEAVMADLQGIDGVNEVTQVNGASVLLHYHGGLKHVVPILKQGVIEHADKIERLQLRPNSLEDVFLHLTGRRLRD